MLLIKTWREYHSRIRVGTSPHDGAWHLCPEDLQTGMAGADAHYLIGNTTSAVTI